jgi:putative inorganic carbon (HCO3(-)) transporter
MISGSAREGFPDYAISHSSRAFTFAQSVADRLSRLLVGLFAWADGCLEGSVLCQAASAGAATWTRLAEGSLLVRTFWPYAKLVVVPFHGRITVETALGLVLALACVAPTEIVMVLASGVFVLQLWSRAKDVRAGKSGTLWALPGFGTVVSVAAVLLFIVGATLSSVDLSLSLFNMFIWFFYFLVFFTAADAGFRGRAENVVWPFLTGAAFSGFISVVQRLTGWTSPIAWVDDVFEENLVRVVGTFTSPIFLAEMMVLALPLSIALLLAKRDWRDRLVLLGFAGLQGLGLLLSQTRGAWLGFAFAFCVLAVLYDWRMLPVGLIVGGVGLAVAPEIFLKRLLSSFSFADTSNAYRVSIWRGSIAMIRDYLFRGVGLGAEAFRKVYPEYMIIGTPAPHAHSTFLQFTLEVGLLGFISMAGLFLVWLYDAFKTVFGERGKSGSRWAEVGIVSGAVAAVAGNLLQGVIDYTWYNPKVTAVFWALVGVAAGIVAAKAKTPVGEQVAAVDGGDRGGTVKDDDR